MKALLLGCGSKSGLYLAHALKEYYNELHIVTSSDPDIQAKIIKVNWQDICIEELLQELDSEYDLVYYNQNCWGGPNQGAFDAFIALEQEWTTGLSINCYLPYRISREIKSNKTIWVTSPFTRIKNRESFGGSEMAGYASYKSTIMHLMFSFAKHSEGIHVGYEPHRVTLHENYAKHVAKVLFELDEEFNGKVINETKSIMEV